MSEQVRPSSVVVAGWILVAVFGALVWWGIGDGAGAVILGVAVVMAAWVALRPGTAAFVVSLVLGVLVAAQETGYLIAGLTDEVVDTGIVLGDALGLVAGLLVTGGAVAALRQRRRVAVAEAA